MAFYKISAQNDDICLLDIEGINNPFQTPLVAGSNMHITRKGYLQPFELAGFEFVGLYFKSSQ